MKKLSLFGISVLGLLLMTGSAFAASDSKGLTATATVSSTAKLDLGGATTLTFPNADPDTSSTIAATEGAINVTAKAKTGSASSVTLEIRSSGASAGDFVSGSDSIAISNLKWTGTGLGFVAGPTTMTNTNQTAASWTGSGSRSGTQSFALDNSWSYATGSYTATITYTLTSP